MDDIQGPDFVISKAEKRLIEDFLRELLSLYPQLKEDVEECDGLLHCQMSALQRFAEDLCEERKLEAARECFEFVEKYFVQAKSDLLNAINVSFLEYFKFFPGLSEGEFKEVMPPTLYQGYVDMIIYMEELARKASELENSEDKYPEGWK
ncbi:MAG: hypothetical protein IPM63_14715 [Acidobacteriota bacterium]|nr:MAG: hypothetical protein IPM63_14715 [Acidobacteriota bacterium]